MVGGESGRNFRPVRGGGRGVLPPCSASRGESGRNFRPVREEWITGAIDRCERRLAPAFFGRRGGIEP